MNADATPTAFWETLSGKLRRAVADRRAAWRTPTLATIGAAGAAQARIVVLRRADPDLGVFEIHTDRRSEKWKALRSTPAAALVFWDPKDQLQLRIEGDARLHADDDDARAALARLSERGAMIYGARPAPGAPISSADAHDQDGDPAAHFGLIRIAARRADALLLAADGHRRADWRFSSGGRSDGGWIAP